MSVAANPAKPLVFGGDSLARIRGFHRVVRLKVGRELRRVQLGAEPKRWKPMPVIGPGVSEIRITQEGEFRVLYVISREQVVFVLHAFQKKSQKTPRIEIDIARRRLRAI